jgi:hypothetical protein
MITQTLTNTCSVVPCTYHGEYHCSKGTILLTFKASVLKSRLSLFIICLWSALFSSVDKSCEKNSTVDIDLRTWIRPLFFLLAAAGYWTTLSQYLFRHIKSYSESIHFTTNGVRWWATFYGKNTFYSGICLKIHMFFLSLW